MPQLRKSGAPRLLKTVDGKGHARPQDYYAEDVDEEAAPGTKTTAGKKQLSESEINADPISSSDEAGCGVEDRSSTHAARRAGEKAVPLPQSSPARGKAMESKRTDTVNSAASTRDNAKQTKKQKKPSSKTMGVPSAGSFKEGQKSKRKIHGGGVDVNEGKENMQEDSSSSGSNKRAWEDEFGWGSQPSSMASSSVPKKKQKYGSSNKPSTSNIHAMNSGSGNGAVGYGKAAVTAAKRGPATTYSSKKQKPSIQYDSESDVSMIDEDPDPHAQLDKLNKKLGFKPKSKSPEPAPPPKPRPNLLASLGSYRQPESSPPDASSYDTPATSQDQNTLCNLESELANLPSEDALNSICPLCQGAVDPKQAIAFWKRHTKTIKNQSKFCKEHRVRSAEREYAEKQYPTIAWADLPARIRRLRPRLERVLRNEPGCESRYRARNAARLVSGQAAAVYRPKHKRRANKNKLDSVEAVEADLELLDPHSDGGGDSSLVSTGYYGPRGRRLMMEVLTTDLGAVFREVAVLDPVVGKSGFAGYIEHVLVPELTVMLVMQDLGLDNAEEAEERIRESAELGVVLNEDVDDVVARGSDEDEDGDREWEVLDLDDDEMYEEIKGKVEEVEEEEEESDDELVLKWAN